jgi:6-phosphogluconolactonase
MIDRRKFAAMLGGAIVAPALTSESVFAQDGRNRAVFYTGVGPELTRYSIDVDSASLTKGASVKLPGGVQYAWPHPSGRYLYVATSGGGVGIPPVAGFKPGEHYLSALRVSPSGDLALHGEPTRLKERSSHMTVDGAGEFVLNAHNHPSSLSVHRINRDGTVGDPVDQPNPLDTGNYAHQIRVTPDNQHVIMCTRGNNSPQDKVVTPGSLKVYGFKSGVLTNLAAVQPGDGMTFGPRHLDFHSTQPWVYVGLESQNKLYVYRRDAATGLSRDPLFVKETLMPGTTPGPRQHVGAIHMHPNGRFVYLTNRDQGMVEFEGKRVHNGGQNNVAVFSIDPATGEPTLLQTADAQAIELRTFGIDPTGRMLVTGSLRPMLVRDGASLKTVPAALSVFRVGNDGKLSFARKYDIDVGPYSIWWSGMVMLA